MRIGVIGATGLVGSRLVPLLRDDEVLLLTRRPSGLAGVTEMVAPAEEWPALLRDQRLDVAVSALGTTWRKAGSWEVFEQIDRHWVVDFASAALAAGARHMISVSSVGADPRSAVEYLALKGRVEADLSRLGFERLDLLRPGLLRGPRGGDRRLKERLGIALSPLTNLFLRGRNARFAAIDATVVARALAALAHAGGSGVHVHHNRDISGLGRLGGGGGTAS